MVTATLARRGRLQASFALQTANTPGDPLEIRDLKLWSLREPASGRRYTVLRLTARSGGHGYGECAATTPGEFSHARASLIGTSASAYEIAWRRLAEAPGLRAAVNMAQLDLLARHTKAPLHQVLGGPTRNKVRAMALLEGSAALERAQGSGFRAFVVPAPKGAWRNAGKAYVQEVATLMQRMRRAGGPAADFVLDGGGRLVPGDAQSIAAELEPIHLLWFDEPCAVSNLGAVRKISSETVTPLGFGRTLGAAGEFHDLLREECADILRPDLAVHGISQVRRIAAIAETCYTAVAPYHNGGPIATAAALHLAATLPNFFIQQIPTSPDANDQEMRKAIAGEIENVRDGFAALPTEPGLGIQVNESALERYQERA